MATTSSSPSSPNPGNSGGPGGVSPSTRGAGPASTSMKPATRSESPSRLMTAGGSLTEGMRMKDKAAPAAKPKGLSRGAKLAIALGLFAAAGAVAAYTLWPRYEVDDSDPDDRRSWISTFTPSIQAFDYRAVNVSVVGEIGKPGAKIVLSGMVSSQRILDDLKSKVSASSPPVPVEWRVEVGWVVGDDESKMPANPR